MTPEQRYPGMATAEVPGHSRWLVSRLCHHAELVAGRRRGQRARCTWCQLCSADAPIGRALPLLLAFQTQPCHRSAEIVLEHRDARWRLRSTGRWVDGRVAWQVEVGDRPGVGVLLPPMPDQVLCWWAEGAAWAWEQGTGERPPPRPEPQLDPLPTNVYDLAAARRGRP